MSVVKINAIPSPRTSKERLRARVSRVVPSRSRHPRASRGYELLRPLEGTDQYLVYTGA
jgi:hypothetical protein